MSLTEKTEFHFFHFPIFGYCPGSYLVHSGFLSHLCSIIIWKHTAFCDILWRIRSVCQKGHPRLVCEKKECLTFCDNEVNEWNIFYWHLILWQHGDIKTLDVNYKLRRDSCSPFASPQNSTLASILVSAVRCVILLLHTHGNGTEGFGVTSSGSPVCFKKNIAIPRKKCEKVSNPIKVLAAHPEAITKNRIFCSYF